MGRFRKCARDSQSNRVPLTRLSRMRAFFCGRPSADNGFSGQVHDGVEIFQVVRLDCARARDPTRYACHWRVRPGEADYLVAVGRQEGKQRMTDQSAGTCQENAHRSNLQPAGEEARWILDEEGLLPIAA